MKSVFRVPDFLRTSFLNRKESILVIRSGCLFRSDLRKTKDSLRIRRPLMRKHIERGQNCRSGDTAFAGACLTQQHENGVPSPLYFRTNRAQRAWMQRNLQPIIPSRFLMRMPRTEKSTHCFMAEWAISQIFLSLSRMSLTGSVRAILRRNFPASSFFPFLYRRPSF